MVTLLAHCGCFGKGIQELQGLRHFGFCAFILFAFRKSFMKSFLRNVVLRLLVGLARIRLKRLRLFIVGVTGSIGKTSTKDAIFTILKQRYQTFKSNKSYNTEFGLPLAILEQDSGFSSPTKWLKTIFGALWKAFIGGRHMQMLVIEMGVDKPGDMDELLKLIHPQVGVMTNIKPVHLAEGQ
ncbi:MAG TPA: Mur ligase family protein, partial [Candidatus Gracilibacteria bacterium]|nr:Mur ligase family protein [Candidatus Gracilibacteria bacterium]